MKRQNVSINDLKALPSVKGTSTFHPVAHYDLAAIVEAQIDSQGFELKSHRIDTNKSGSQAFGTLILNSGNDSDFMLGWRNSTDKTLSIGLCSGLHIVNCANLMFSGKFLTFRKHTSGLYIEEVEDLTKEAVIELPVYKEQMDTKLAQYAEIEIETPVLKEITYDLIMNKVFSPSQFHNFHNCMDEEMELGSNVRTLNTVHNGVTRLLRKQPLMTVSDSTPLLTAVTDDYYLQYAA